MSSFCATLTPYDVDPRRWERVRRATADAMVASGWTRRAKKFPEVLHRRALRTFWASV